MKATNQYERDAQREVASKHAQAVEFVNTNKDRAFKSYSGRVGCMCGCRGRYRVAANFQEFAGRDRGYAVTSDEVSDRCVDNDLEWLLQSGTAEVEKMYAGLQHVYAEDQDGRRCRCVYFKMTESAGRARNY